jgi:hypothetical protein
VAPVSDISRSATENHFNARVLASGQMRVSSNRQCNSRFEALLLKRRSCCKARNDEKRQKRKTVKHQARNSR